MASLSVAPPGTRGKQTGEIKKPNFQEFQAKIAVERDQIGELFKKLNALTAQISAAQNGQSTFGRQREEIRVQVDACTRKIEELEAERDKLFGMIDETQRSERDLKSKVQLLKKNLGVQSEAEINLKISEIERQIMSSRLSVQEENRLINQIKQLRNSRPLVEQCTAMETIANTHSQTSVAPLRIRFDEIREELRQQQLQRRTLLETRRKMMEEHRMATAPLRDLFDERDELRKQLAQHRQQEASLRDEMSNANRVYKALLAKVQWEKQKLDMEEKRHKELDREREHLQQQLDTLEDADNTPSSLEHRVALRLHNYVKSLNDAFLATNATEVNAVAESENLQITDGPLNRSLAHPPQGVLMPPKCDRDDNPPSMSNRKKQGRKTRSANKILAIQQQPLTHDLITLSDFAHLGIGPPTLPSDCEACLRMIEEKLEILKSQNDKLKESTRKRRDALLLKLQALDLREGINIKQSVITTEASSPCVNNDNDDVEEAENKDVLTNAKDQENVESLHDTVDSGETPQ